MYSVFSCRGSAFIILGFVIITLSYSFVESKDSLAWKLLKTRASSDFLSKGSAKKLEALKSVEDNPKSVLAIPTRSTTSTSRDTDTVRQYGQYSSSSYGGSGGGYDIYTLIAVSAFAALFGALVFELVTNGSLRSMDSATLQLPFGLESEQLPMLVAKITDWVSNSPWMEQVVGAGKSRTLRDVGSQIGVSKWIQAYKKDPIEYQCVRKFACETLASSEIIQRSMKSPFGGMVLAAVGALVDQGEELQSVIQNTVGNPDNCQDMAPWEFCDDDIAKKLVQQNKTD